MRSESCVLKLFVDIEVVGRFLWLPSGHWLVPAPNSECGRRSHQAPLCVYVREKKREKKTESEREKLSEFQKESIERG